MKTLLIAALLSASFQTQAKPIISKMERVITVQAQGKTIKLNTSDISHLKYVCHNPAMLSCLSSMSVIKNNDVADLILGLMATNHTENARYVNNISK